MFVGISLSLLGGLLSSAFSPKSLFSAGEKGQLMAASLATLYQDTAGTTPVTATGQAVALWLDQSGRGNHDTQSTVGSRPIYGKHPANGYRNMLASSDTLSTQNITTLATQKTLSFTGTGTVALTGTYIGVLVGIGVSNRVSLTFTPTAGTLTLTVTGSVTLAMLQDGAAFTTYQRTGATSGAAWPAPPSYDITEAGQPDLGYLHFNGVSSFMGSPTITPGIDKSQVFLGVRKLSDAARGVIFDLGGGATGSIAQEAPSSAGVNDFTLKSVGTAFVPVQILGLSAPISSVISGLSDIGAPSLTIHVNKSQISTSTATQGTGNYLSYPIYTGRRGGISLPFNGLVYSKIVRFGPNLNSTQISATESWTAQLTGVTLP